MGFLAPWFLAGSAAIGLPLWIHLLRQYRSTPHPFSSLMFFERRTQSSIKHRRLRYLLLLSLRVALLLLLALAFANPFVTRSAANSSARKMLVIAVDNSFSMRYGDHLARAKQEALQAVSNSERRRARAKCSQSDRTSICSRSRWRMPISSRPPFNPSSPPTNAAPTANSRERCEPSRNRRACRSKCTSPATCRSRRCRPSFADLRLGGDTNLVFHSVANTREPNWLVQSVTAPGKIYDPEKGSRASRHCGHRNRSCQANRLAGPGRPRCSKRNRWTVPAGGRATVEFLSLESPYGFHKAEIRIEPADSLREDDRFPFAVERADPHPVLFLHDAGQQQGELYYRAALESVPEAGFVLGTAGSGTGHQPIAFEIRFRSTFRCQLAAARPRKQLARLRQRRRIASGRTGSAIGRSQRMSRSRTKPSREPAMPAAKAIDSRSSPPPMPSIPSLRRANKLDGVQFYQVVRVDPGQSRVIARLSNQVPLLLEKQVGEGRVLVFASTFDNISNDFPLHASFVPFVEETAQYLGGQQGASTNVAVDSFIELRSAKDQGASVDVIDPDGRHPLSLKEAATTQSFQVNREGFYEIHRANGRVEMVAVHADRQESDLTPVPQETLDLWRNTGRGPDTTAATAKPPAKPDRRACGVTLCYWF